MPRSSRWSEAGALDDDGSAALEFIFVGLLLLVPIVYLIVALGAVQHQALGVEAGARHIARSVATAANDADARARADGILAAVVGEYDLDAQSVGVSVECLQAAASCPAAGATVIVTVRSRVALPLVPPVLGLDRLGAVPVEASSAQKVSRFWSDG